MLAASQLGCPICHPFLFWLLLHNRTHKTVPINSIPNICSLSHHNQSILVAGKGSPDQPITNRYALNYHSVYDNKILRKFRGHTDVVNHISMNPADDTFLTSSRDRTVRCVYDNVSELTICAATVHSPLADLDVCFTVFRLWSLQQAGAIGILELPSQAQGDPHVAFDSTGLVFGITASMTAGQGHVSFCCNLFHQCVVAQYVPVYWQNDVWYRSVCQWVSSGLTLWLSFYLHPGFQYVHLYDARNYSGGAFAEMKVTTTQLEKTVTQKQAKSDWTGMTFNASGNQILVTGKNGLCVTLDGYDGTLQRSLSSPGASSACWTSDDKTVLVGNEDGTISCWNVETGAMIRKLEGHTGTVSWVGVNPKYSMFASCDSTTALWIW